MSSPGRYRLPPSTTLTAAWGHPETKGFLPADTQLLHGSLIPSALQYFAIRLSSSLPCLSQHPWGGKGQRLDKQTMGVHRDDHSDSCCFFCTPSEMQRCRVQKSGYLWTKFLRLFYCKGWRTSCLPQWSSEGSEASGLSVFPLYRIFLESTII